MNLSIKCYQTEAINLITKKKNKYRRLHRDDINKKNKNDTENRKKKKMLKLRLNKHHERPKDCRTTINFASKCDKYRTKNKNRPDDN